MPRTRRTPVRAKVKTKHYRCRSCGAIVPTCYACLCPQSRLIEQVHRLFPGTREVN